MKLSTRLEGVAESSTLKMNAAVKALQSQGQKVINFTAGEPDFPVPEAIRRAAITAIEEGFSKYTPVAGIPDLRRALSKKFKSDNGLEYGPEDTVVTCGAKQAIFNFLLAAISPGDEVIIPAPYWVSYPEMVKLVGGVPVIVETEASSDFKMNEAQLRGALTKKTRALILNSPSNPTGAVYSGSELKRLAGALEGTDVLVVSDEIYEKLVFDGQKFESFAAQSQDAFKRTLTVNGFSKTYSMTGWRLGYAAGPRDLINAMVLLQGQSTSGANSVAQKAALAALEIPHKNLEDLCQAFEKRRNKMVEIFSQSPFFSFVEPQGAFYFFLNIEELLGKQYTHDEILAGSEDVAFYLLNSAHVGSVPGVGFGADKYLRLSFAVSDHDVEEGAKAIVAAAKKLK